MSPVSSFLENIFHFRTAFCKLDLHSHFYTAAVLSPVKAISSNNRTELPAALSLQILLYPDCLLHSR